MYKELLNIISGTKRKGEISFEKDVISSAFVLNVFFIQTLILKWQICHSNCVKY